MSPLAEFDQQMERIIREFAMRIVVPRGSEFDMVWEAAIRVCDRYELGKSRQGAQSPQISGQLEQHAVTSSVAPSVTDEPAQTPPPIDG